MHAVLRWKFRAAGKNSCDAVVAEFFVDALPGRYRNAFHLKARSHCAVTALGGRLRWLVVCDGERLNSRLHLSGAAEAIF